MFLPDGLVYFGGIVSLALATGEFSTHEPADRYPCVNSPQTLTHTHNPSPSHIPKEAS